MNRILILSLLILIVLVSCKKDPTPNEPFVGDPAPIRFGISTKGGDIPTEIYSLRVLVFDAAGNKTTNKLVSFDQSTLDQYNTVVEANIGNGFTYYLIANELSNMVQPLNNITTESGLRTIRVDYQAETEAIKKPLVMIAKATDVQVRYAADEAYTLLSYTNKRGESVVQSSQMDLELERIGAKLTFYLIKNYSGFEFSEIELSIHQMPKTTLLTSPTANTPQSAAEYAPTALFKAPSSAKLINDINGIKGTTDFKFYTITVSPTEVTDYTDNVYVFEDIYLPEHLLNITDPDKVEEQATYIIIQATASSPGGTDRVVKYQSQVINPIAPHHIERNTHYKMMGKIVSLGSVGLYADVIKVNQNNTTVTWLPSGGMMAYTNLESDWTDGEQYFSNIDVDQRSNAHSSLLKLRTFEKDAVTGMITSKIEHVVFKYGSIIPIKIPAVSYATTNPYTIGPPPVSGLTFGAAADCFELPAYVTEGAIATTEKNVWTWDMIPYQTPEEDTPGWNTGEISRISHSLTQLKQGKGDPCKLIGITTEQVDMYIKTNGLQGRIDNGTWEMTRDNQYRTLVDAVSGATQDARGFNAMQELLVPNSYYRASSNGNVKTDYNLYWARNAYVFTFDGGNANPKTAQVSMFIPNSAPGSTTGRALYQSEEYPRNAALTVRCRRRNQPTAVFSIGGTTTTYTEKTPQNPMIINVSAYGIPSWKIGKSKWESGVDHTIDPQPEIQIEDVNGGIHWHVPHTYYIYYAKSDAQIYLDMTKNTSNLTPRTFHLYLYGVGYDGSIRERDVTITQNPYQWNTTITKITDMATGKVYTESNFNTLAIPQSGGNYVVSFNLSPQENDIPYRTDAGKPIYYMAQAYTDGSYVFCPAAKIGTANDPVMITSPAGAAGELNYTITIPQNRSGYRRGVYFVGATTVSKADYPTLSSDPGYAFYQDALNSGGYVMTNQRIVIFQEYQ